MAKKGNEAQSLSARAWRKFRRNKLAWFGMAILFGAILISVLGANVRPDYTKNSDNQIPVLKTKPPGFEQEIFTRSVNKDVDVSGFFGQLGFGYTAPLYEFYPIDTFRFEGAFVYIEEHTEIESKKGQEDEILLADVLYQLEDKTLFHEDGNGNLVFYVIGEGKTVRSIAEMREEVKENHVETVTFWLGTDDLGRDYLSRLMAGSIISLLVGIISVIISLVIGITLGAMAGYFRGWVDDAVMYIINVVWSIPTILMVFAITIVLGKGYWQVFIAVGLTMWVEVARIVRGQVMSVREKEFVEAGKALGYGSGRLIWKHVVPNIMGPVIVISAANFAAAILIEAGLSFLGIGTQLPTPSWGNLVKENFAWLDQENAYLAILPGICIIIMVLAIMLIGNALRDAIDSRSTDSVSV